MTAEWSDDLQLLIRLLRRDHDGAARCLRSRRAPADDFLAFIVEHKLAVAGRNALEGSPLRGAFSPERLAALGDVCRARTTRAQALLAELEHLADRFHDAGQPFVLLKGPYLAARYYGNELGREFVDLDVLVPRADRARAFRLLGAAGYARKSRTLLGVGLTCFFVHGFDFTNGRGKVDLHWALSRHPSFRIDERTIWVSRQSYRVAGRAYDVLSDEHDVVLAVLSLLRDIERGGAKLKNLVDLFCILDALDATQDWDAFLAARRRERILDPTVNVLRLCLAIAGTPDLFPNLQSTLERYAGRAVPLRLDALPFVLAPTRFGLGNKMWSARVHEGSPATWFLWWAVSLPFRTAVRNRRRNSAAAPS